MKKRTLHERKIMLTFFLFKTTCLFWIPRLFGNVRALSLCANGGIGDTGAFREWASAGSSVYRGAVLGQPWVFLHKFGLKGCHRPQMELCCSLFTLWSSQLAHAAVLDRADNALLCARPSQQLLYVFRHTRLHRTDEWVKIGGRHILIPIISVWLGGVIGIIGLGRPSGLHMFPFSPRLLCWSALISLMSSKPECNPAGCFQPVLRLPFHGCFGSDEAYKTCLDYGGGDIYLWNSSLSPWTATTLNLSFPPQPKKWLPWVCFTSLAVYMFISSFILLDHWCTCSLSLHDSPPPPSPTWLFTELRYWWTLPGCYEKKQKTKNKNTQGLTHEDNLVREDSREAKVWKQSEHPDRCGVYALRAWGGGTRSFCGKRRCAIKDSDIVSYRCRVKRKRLLKQPLLKLLF